jgi:enoyl-CoA hydratase
MDLESHATPASEGTPMTATAGPERDGVEQHEATPYDGIRYSVVGRVAHITLARPQVGNALSMKMRGAIGRAALRADSDPAVAVVVIDADGPSFCTGYDLKEPYGSRADREADDAWVSDPNLERWTDQFARSCVRDWLRCWDLQKPIVAVARGNCLGGGVELLMTADIAFVDDDTRIGYPPVRAMSTPDVPVLAWRTTIARAKYLQLTGCSITGADAAAWGLVAKSFPAGQLAERAAVEIEALASIDSALLAANKHQVNAAYEQMGMRQHLQQGWMWHHLSGEIRPHHGEFFERARQEGMRAALEWMNGPFRDAGLR